MSQVRVALVGVAPILGDVIRRVLATRPGTERIVLGNEPAGSPADIVIFGPDATPAREAATRLGPRTRVLRLSPDLTALLGPGPAESTPLTPDALADRLVEIARTI